MKKILLFALCLSVAFLCSCKKIYEIENNKLVAACSIKVKNDDVSYGFYISYPGGDSKDASGAENSLVLCEFKADNFSKALKKLEKSGSLKLDVSHISFICADTVYFKNHFKDDEKYLRKSASSTPLINCFIYEGKNEDLTKCLKSEYNSRANKFTDAMFQKNENPYGCTLSELSLSQHNEFYTSAIPMVSISKKGRATLPEISGTSLYSSKSGLTNLSKREHSIYSKWRKKHLNESRGYRISQKEKTLKVSLKDKNITDLARKYAMMNVDILNVKYYGRRCFNTYEKYEKFMEKLNLWDISVSGG